MHIISSKRIDGWIPKGTVLNAKYSRKKVSPYLIALQPDDLGGQTVEYGSRSITLLKMPALSDQSAIRLQGHFLTPVMLASLAWIGHGVGDSPVFAPDCVDPFHDACITLTNAYFVGTLQVVGGNDIPTVTITGLPTSETLPSLWESRTRDGRKTPYYSAEAYFTLYQPYIASTFGAADAVTDEVRFSCMHPQLAKLTTRPDMVDGSITTRLQALGCISTIDLTHLGGGATLFEKSQSATTAELDIWLSVALSPVDKLDTRRFTMVPRVDSAEDEPLLFSYSTDNTAVLDNDAKISTVMRSHFGPEDQRIVGHRLILNPVLSGDGVINF